MEKQDKWTNLMYYVVFGLSHLLSLLPFCILYFLSDGLYLLMYYCIKYRRDVVRDNLLKSFPEKSEILSLFLRLFCRNFEADFHLEKGNEEADGISWSGAGGTGRARRGT